MKLGAKVGELGKGEEDVSADDDGKEKTEVRYIIETDTKSLDEHRRAGMRLQWHTESIFLSSGGRPVSRLQIATAHVQQ